MTQVHRLPSVDEQEVTPGSGGLQAIEIDLDRGSDLLEASSASVIGLGIESVDYTALLLLII